MFIEVTKLVDGNVLQEWPKVFINLSDASLIERCNKGKERTLIQWSNTYMYVKETPQELLNAFYSNT